MDSDGNCMGIYWNIILWYNIIILFGGVVAEDIPKWPEKSITKHKPLTFWIHSSQSNDSCFVWPMANLNEWPLRRSFWLLNILPRFQIKSGHVWKFGTTDLSSSVRCKSLQNVIWHCARMFFLDMDHLFQQVVQNDSAMQMKIAQLHNSRTVNFSCLFWPPEALHLVAWRWHGTAGNMTYVWPTTRGCQNWWAARKASEAPVMEFSYVHPPAEAKSGMKSFSKHPCPHDGANSHGNDDLFVQFTIELLRVDGGISEMSSLVRGTIKMSKAFKSYIPSWVNYFPDGIKMVFFGYGRTLPVPGKSAEYHGRGNCIGRQSQIVVKRWEFKRWSYPFDNESSNIRQFWLLWMGEFEYPQNSIKLNHMRMSAGAKHP